MFPPKKADDKDQAVKESLSSKFGKKPAPKVDEKEPVKMADGGVVPDDTDTTPSAAAPTFDAGSGLPQGSDYYNHMKAQASQYGPAQQQAVTQSILQNQNGLRGRVANAGAGLADALMQGVARAGSGNFQANLQNRQAAQADMVQKSLDNQRAANTQNLAENQKIDLMNPGSTPNVQGVSALAPILAKIGAPLGAGATAADAGKVADLGTEAQKSAATLKLGEGQIANAQAQLGATKAFQQGELGHMAAEEGAHAAQLKQDALNQGAERRVEGAKEVVEHTSPMAAKIQDAFHALLKFVPESQRGVALKSLASIGQNGTASGQDATIPAAAHPEANDAVAWAQANPQDPRAAEILKRLGAK